MKRCLSALLLFFAFVFGHQAWAQSEQVALQQVQEEVRRIEAMSQYGELVDLYSDAIAQRKWSKSTLSQLYLGRALAKRKQNRFDAALKDFDAAEQLMSTYSNDVLILAQGKADAYHQQQLVGNGISELLRLYEQYKQPEPLANLIGDYFLNRVGDLARASEYYTKAGNVGEQGEAFIQSMGKSYAQIQQIYQPLIAQASKKDQMRLRKVYADALNRSLTYQAADVLQQQNKEYAQIISDCRNDQSLVFVCRQNDIEPQVAAYLVLNLLQLNQVDKATQVAKKYFPVDKRYQWMHYVAIAFAQAKQAKQLNMGVVTLKQGLKIMKPPSHDLKHIPEQNAYTQLALAQYALAQQLNDSDLKLNSLKKAVRWANAWQLGDLYTLQAGLFKTNGSLAEAEQRFILALNYIQDPYRKASVHVQLTDVLYLQGKKAKALQSLKKASELAPLTGELWASIAAMEKEQGNLNAYKTICQGEFSAMPAMRNVCRAQSGEDLPRYRAP